MSEFLSFAVAAVVLFWFVLMGVNLLLDKGEEFGRDDLSRELCQSQGYSHGHYRDGLVCWNEVTP